MKSFIPHSVKKYYNSTLQKLKTKFPDTYVFIKKYGIRSERFLRHLASKRWFQITTITLGTLFIAFSLFFLSIYVGLWGKLPTEYELANLKQSLASRLLDKDGNEIGKYFVYDRRPIDYDELPQHLVDALVATEDFRFYKHDGVDKLSLMRVLVKTLMMQDESAGGGSTITQQLAKNMFGREESGKLGLVVSKMKEFILAQRIENIYTKNEIINLYFNTVPFPDNTYGIESASQKFFDKPTKELNLNESAILVGTLKANHWYNPRLYPDRAKTRRDVVLGQMMRYGYLQPQDTVGMERDSIVLHYRDKDQAGVAGYFKELTRKQLENILKDKIKKNGQPYDLYLDGLTIYTTMDLKMQQMAEASMKKHMAALQKAYSRAYGSYAPWKRMNILLPSLKKLPAYKNLEKEGLEEGQIWDSLDHKREMHVFAWDSLKQEQNLSVKDSLSHYLSILNCGFLALEPNTGKVLSYIGGIDFNNFKYDHVSQSQRMVGSTFKPFVYTTAVERGIEPCDLYPSVADTYIIRGKEWTPGNSGGESDPDVKYSLKGALANSINTVAVKVILDAGIDNVIHQAHRMGIDADLPKVPSLALGTAQIKLLDLAGAYTTFVNKGRPATPYTISKIVDREGNIIYEHQDNTLEEEAVMTDYTRQSLIEMLKETVNSGTAARLRYKYRLKNDIAGKTGTTQDNKDGWFVSIMPKMVTVSWVGNDDYRIGFNSTSMGAGANSALPIFAGLMQQMNKDTIYDAITQAKFEKPSSRVREATSCPAMERDSSSVKNIFRNIFGGSQKRTRNIVYLDDDGNRIKTVKEEIEDEETEDAGDTQNEDADDDGGFFSFLKKKKDNDGN
ncbi:MAG: penicillin-binding protein [Cytophagaceae bacterium]|nr:penicillin-binding protein [Cytophagaceae bacterium]